MHVTGPAALATEHAAAGALAVTRAARRAVGVPSAQAADPALRRYVTDMVAPYGLQVRDDVFAAGAGQSYGEMTAPLLDEVVGADTPVDVLVLASDVHDVRFGRNTTTWLGSRCPGGPLAFGLCDQGVVAPFAALRAIAAYTATGVCRRALLLVAEQSTLHYEPAGPAPLPRRDTAIALVLEPAAGAATARQLPAVAAADVRTALAVELAAVARHADTDGDTDGIGDTDGDTDGDAAGRVDAGGDEPTIVLGAGLAATLGIPAGRGADQGPGPDPGPDAAPRIGTETEHGAGVGAALAAAAAAGRLVVADADMPCAGVWWALAALAAGPSGADGGDGAGGVAGRARSVVLAEHDARLGVLAVAALRLAPAASGRLAAAGLATAGAGRRTEES